MGTEGEEEFPGACPLHMGRGGAVCGGSPEKWALSVIQAFLCRRELLNTQHNQHCQVAYIQALGCGSVPSVAGHMPYGPSAHRTYVPSLEVSLNISPPQISSLLFSPSRRKSAFFITQLHFHKQKTDNHFKSVLVQ